MSLMASVAILVGAGFALAPNLEVYLYLPPHMPSPHPTERNLNCGSKTKLISCVIPAYNEAGRVAHVVTTIMTHPDVDEVIVIDDGSTDPTREELLRIPGIKLIVHERNNGKSHAIANGVRRSRNPIIMLLDADLCGLTNADVTALAEPVLAGYADATISLRRNCFLIHKWLGLDFLSGERVFPKSLISDHLDEISSMPSFAFESFLNRQLLRRGCRVRVVKWQNVSHARKHEKVGFLNGAIAEMRMVRQVLNFLSVREILAQNFGLLSSDGRLPRLLKRGLQ